MKYRGDSAEQRRPLSDNLVDLHVSVVPMEHWVERLNYASHQIIGETFSAGFLRVFPDTLVSNLRDEIKAQLGSDILPQEYVFLKHVGRCLALVRQKQELELKVKNFLPPHSIMPEIFVLPGKPTMYTYSVLPPIKPSIHNTINDGDITVKSDFHRSQKYVDSLSASYNNTPQPEHENLKKNAKDSKKNSVPLPKSAHKSPAKSQVTNSQRKTDLKRQKRHVSGKSSYENEQNIVIPSTEMVTNIRRGPTSPGQASDEFGGMAQKDHMAHVTQQSQQQFNDQSPSLAKSTLHDGPKKRRVRYNMPNNNQSNASSQEFDDYNLHDNHVANGYQPDPKFSHFNPNNNPHNPNNKNTWQEYDKHSLKNEQNLTQLNPPNRDHFDDFRDHFDPVESPKLRVNFDPTGNPQSFDLKARENFHPLGDSESSSVRAEFVTSNYPKGNFPGVKPNNTNDDSGYVENSDSDEFTNQEFERIDQRSKILGEKGNSQINQQQNNRVWQLNNDLNTQNNLIPQNKSNEFNFKQNFEPDLDINLNTKEFKNQTDNPSNNGELLHHNSINNSNYERQINPPLEIFDRNHENSFNQHEEQNNSDPPDINETGSKLSYRLSQQGYHVNNNGENEQNNYEAQENYEYQENARYSDDDSDESNYESEENDFQNELRSFMQTQSHDFVINHENDRDVSHSHDFVHENRELTHNLSHENDERNQHRDESYEEGQFYENSKIPHDGIMKHENSNLNLTHDNHHDSANESHENNVIVNPSQALTNFSQNHETNHDENSQHENIVDNESFKIHENHDTVYHDEIHQTHHDVQESQNENLGVSVDHESHHDSNESQIENNKSQTNNFIENTLNPNGSTDVEFNDVTMLPRQSLEGVEVERRESLSGSSERKETPVMVVGFVTSQSIADNPLEGDFNQIEDKVSRGAPDGMPTQRKVNTGGDKKPGKVYPQLDEETATIKDQVSMVAIDNADKNITVENSTVIEDKLETNVVSVENQVETLENVNTQPRNQPTVSNPPTHPSPSPIRIPQFNKPAVERQNDTPSPDAPKTSRKTTENRVSKEVTKGTARITTVSQKGENGVRLGSPDRSKLWNDLQRIRGERRTSEKQRQDLVRQAKVTTSKMNQKRTSVTAQMEKMFPQIQTNNKKKTPGPGERCFAPGCYYVFHTKQDKKRHFGLVHRGLSTGQWQQRGRRVRDMWKKKFFEEKKKTTPLEETCKRLQVELDTTHQRLVSAMEGGVPRVAQQQQRKFPSILPHIGKAPSIKHNSKIQVTRLQHNMDNLRRKIEDAKIKLTGEIKLRHQAEQQVKSVRQELLARKIQAHLAYRKSIRGHAYPIRSKV